VRMIVYENEMVSLCINTHIYIHIYIYNNLCIYLNVNSSVH
jgi:hypothetical protein